LEEVRCFAAEENARFLAGVLVGDPPPPSTLTAFVERRTKMSEGRSRRKSAASVSRSSWKSLSYLGRSSSSKKKRASEAAAFLEGKS
jgi:hypothetical protein